MANEKNRPPQHSGQNDPPEHPRNPTRQRETNDSGDPKDDSGEDNQQQK